jgi:hypothetical protein
MAEPHVAEMGRADARSERAAGGGAGLPAARGARRANPERDAAWGEEEGEYGHGKRAALVARRPSMAVFLVACHGEGRERWDAEYAVA